MTVFLTDMKGLPVPDQLEEAFRAAVQRDFAGQPSDPGIPMNEKGRKRFWAEVNKELICGKLYPEGISVAALPAIRKEWAALETSLSRPVHLYLFIPRSEAGLCEILEKESYYAARFATTGISRTVRILQYMSAGTESLALRELVSCTIYASPSNAHGRRAETEGEKPSGKVPYLYFEESKLSEEELVDFLELGMEIHFLRRSKEKN